MGTNPALKPQELEGLKPFNFFTQIKMGLQRVWYAATVM